MTNDCVQGVGHSPVCQILLQIVNRVLIIIASPPAWTSSVGITIIITIKTIMTDTYCG